MTMAYLSLLELVENISKFRRKLSFRISSFSYLVDPGEARDSITISLLLTKNRKFYGVKLELVYKSSLLVESSERDLLFDNDT